MSGINVAALLAHNRELGGEIDAIHSRLTRLEQQARERDAHHEAERKRWHEHMRIMQGHLYRLIDEKRARELQDAAFEEAAARPSWPVLYQPAPVTDEINFADIARFQRELLPNPTRQET